jgi:hypothetical protein
MSNLRCGHVYFSVMRDPRDPVLDFRLVKIGITQGDVLDRVSALQTGNPYDLVHFDSFETPWPREVEHFMHRTHATEMIKPEWLRCGRDDLCDLVAEAKAEAQRIESRKLNERAYATQTSNGESRRATTAEFQLHHDARTILKELVPAKLDLKIAGYRLAGATDTRRGISGIVRAKYVPAANRFHEGLAKSKFPRLASQFVREDLRGGFRWRGVQRESDFADRCEEARSAKESAERSETDVLQSGATLQGWTDRTPVLEAWHDDFLQALRKVHRLAGDLADIRTELIIGLQDYDAIDRVCSFIRRPVLKIDRSAFRSAFPDEYKQCEIEIAPRLRKFVYPTRSYLSE